MIFSLDVRRAHQGDCLLLHFGSEEKPGLAIIDGGPADVWRPQLKPRLMEIREARNLDAQKPLRVDLLMVSHADDDHIRGILDLTGELKENTATPLVRVTSFWHNSFDDIIGNRPEELTAAVAAQFGAAALDGELPADASLDADQDEEVIRDNLKVLASVAQGSRLRGDAQRLGFPRNPEFDGKLIMAAEDPVPVARGLQFIVAGPMQDELEKLQKDHDKWLKTRKGKTPEAALAAYIDDSVTNLSSIVVLAEVEGKTMLLTGDARGDRILEGLELVGALQAGGSMRVDVLKVPHHGSSRNLDADFFERITAAHYVFSGDGAHGNPERASMEMLFQARGAAPFQVHLTYPVDEIDIAREADWKIEQAKERERKKKGGKKPVRENWSDAKHSLAAFLEKNPLKRGQKLHIVPDDKPHVINLLDKLGF